MKLRRVNGKVALAVIGFVAGAACVGVARLLLAPSPLPESPEDEGAMETEQPPSPSRKQWRRIRTAPPPPHEDLPPPRLGIGMAGMTRFVAVLVVFAVVATAAGIAGVVHATSNQSRQEAIAMTGGDPDRGQVAIDHYGCASCHTIPGIRGADAAVGPPLTQFGARMYVGGVLANTPDNLVHWILNPPGVDPKTAMPNLHVTEADARDIACYLYTLR